MLEQYRRAPTWVGRLDIQQLEPTYARWGALRSDAKKYLDSKEWERFSDVPEVLRDLPVLKLRRPSPPLYTETVSFRVDRAATIYLAVPSQAIEKVPELATFTKMDETLEGAVLYRKDVPAGPVDLKFLRFVTHIVVGPRGSEEKAR